MEVEVESQVQVHGKARMMERNVCLPEKKLAVAMLGLCWTVVGKEDVMVRHGRRRAGRQTEETIKESVELGQNPKKQG